jgi:hypothetical protein
MAARNRLHWLKIPVLGSFGYLTSMLAPALVSTVTVTPGEVPLLNLKIPTNQEVRNNVYEPWFGFNPLSPLIGSSKELAEACLSSGIDTQQAHKFQLETIYIYSVLDQISRAKSQEEIVQVLTDLHARFGAEFYLYTPDNQAAATTLESMRGIFPWERVETSPWQGSESVEGLEDLRKAAADLARAYMNFTFRELKVVVEKVVFTGDSRGFSAVYEQGTIIIDLANVIPNSSANLANQYPDTVISQWLPKFDPPGKASHEILHGIFGHLMEQSGTGHLRFLEMPPEFEFVGDYEYALDLPSSWFEPGPDQVFPGRYAATDPNEYVAELGRLLITDGLIGKEDPNWGSPYHINQLGVLICRETLSPGYLNYLLALEFGNGLYLLDARDFDLRFGDYLKSNSDPLLTLTNLRITLSQPNQPSEEEPSSTRVFPKRMPPSGVLPSSHATSTTTTEGAMVAPAAATTTGVSR